MGSESPSSKGADVRSDDCLLRIREALPDLKGARRQVAECILRSPHDVLGLPIGELARLSGASENAVNRFARSLGYSGYRTFAQALAFDLGRIFGIQHTLPLDVLAADAGDDTFGLVTRIFETQMNAVAETARRLDATTIEGAVEALANASRILFLGTGSTSAVCQTAQYRCSSLGLVAHWAADPMVMVSEASGLGPGDVVVAISSTGRSRDVLEVLAYASQVRKTTTIAITAEPRSHIATLADIALIVHDPEPTVGARHFTARTSATVLLEALITAVTVRAFGSAPPTLEELGQMQSHINTVDGDWEPAMARQVREGGATDHDVTR